jgi:antirestriction protein ArdC
LTHWTGHPGRCNRDLRNRFGSEAYAAEELIAEIGAAILCATLDIAPTTRLDHAQYVATWLDVLRADKKAIFTASSKAQQAADYLASLQAPARTAEAA